MNVTFVGFHLSGTVRESQNELDSDTESQFGVSITFDRYGM